MSSQLGMGFMGAVGDGDFAGAEALVGVAGIGD